MEKLSALLSVSHELDLDNLLKGVDPDDYIIDSIKADKGGKAAVCALYSLCTHYTRYVGRTVWMVYTRVLQASDILHASSCTVTQTFTLNVVIFPMTMFGWLHLIGLH